MAKRKENPVNDLISGYNKAAKVVKQGPAMFPGEKHNFISNPEGQVMRANFMGPGTHVYERIVRGDIPVSLSDRIAEEHDLRYDHMQVSWRS